jgi:hypothetical protein
MDVEARKEYYRKYYIKNKECIKERNRAYREKQREERNRLSDCEKEKQAKQRRIYDKVYYRTNREVILDRAKKYHQNKRKIVKEKESN